MRVDICLPVYNEETILRENSSKLLDYCFGAGFDFDWRLVFLVNGSSDSSINIAKDFESRFPKNVLALSSEKKGRGGALKDFWLSSPADILLYMDVDLAVSLNHLRPLIDSLFKENFDLAMGSRLLPDSKIERSFWRELVSRSHIFLSRLLLGHSFSDLQCGFKAVKKDKFKEIAPLVEGRGWFFDTELVVWGLNFAWRVKELPVEWEENRYDCRQSKVNVFSDSFAFIKEMIALRNRIIKNKKLK